VTTYILRRVLWLIPVLFVVSVITFLLMHLAPGGPFQGAEQRQLPPAVIANLERQFGLDRPLHEQYINWVGSMLTGDLGPSFRYRGRGVNDIVADGIFTTVQLGAQAFLLAVIVGIPLGVVAALRQNKLPDYLATFVSVLGISTPSFVLATLLILVFASTLRWFPTFGWRGPDTWVLPTIALAGYGIAQIARFTRASMLEVTRRDYIRTAHSKGIRERSVVVIHMLRNALIPVVTILGPLFAAMVTGSFIVESIFAVPGIGRFYVESIFTRDYGVIMAMTVIYAFAIAVMNLIVDVAYAWIDPRIRYS
jgi:oligopeptide transport system permease protein